MTTAEPETRRLTRKLLVALITAGALLVALVVVVVLLLTRANADGEPVAAPTPTETDSSTATPTVSPSSTPTQTPVAVTPTPTVQPPPPPPSNQTKINSFQVSNTTVTCNTNAPNPSEQYISFSWATSNVNQVYFGVNTNDASQGAFFDNLPPSGTSQDDFPPGYNDFTYPCPSASTKYTLTVVGPTGKVSQSVTVTNNGDK